MSIPFKSRFSRLFLWLAAIFILMFLFRLFYGYSVSDMGEQADYSESFFDNLQNVRKNYASEKISGSAYASKESEGSDAFATGQKYEKTASVNSRSSEFEKEEAHIKNATQRFNAVIQYEQSRGNKGNRVLHLIIGVNPALFDSFYTVTQTVGLVSSRSVTKVDKTNEYRELNAKKTSLQKTLASLNELKSRSGSINDYVSLHDKILEVEEKLQELGVELGNFDTQNEFCTLRFSLYEGAKPHKANLATRIKIALQWTISYYLRLVVSLAFLAALTFLILVIVDRFKILRAVVSKMNDGGQS